MNLLKCILCLIMSAGFLYLACWAMHAWLYEWYGFPSFMTSLFVMAVFMLVAVGYELDKTKNGKRK